MLPCWLETTGTDAGNHFARFWIRTNGNETIYLYYGNPGAHPASNGEDTFSYFDHWTSDTTSDWLSGTPSSNNFHRWENTTTFNTGRILTAHAMLQSWQAGPWDYSVLGWTSDQTSTWRDVDHVAVQWSMRTGDGATDETVRIRIHIKAGDNTTTTTYRSVAKPDPDQELILSLWYCADIVRYTIIDSDTGVVLVDDQMTTADGDIPDSAGVSYLFSNQLDSGGGIFSWLSPTFLRWGNKIGANGGGEWYVDSWFVSNYSSIEPFWLDYGTEQTYGRNGGSYGSPMKMQENDEWQWSNFTWQNPDIPTGTVVGWRIYYSDTGGQVNKTDVMSFRIGVSIVGDVDGDGDVDLSDLAALLGAYGDCEGDPDYNPAADFDDSGCVDLSDLATLLGNYGYGT